MMALFELLGGLGIFLLGVVIMTSGLKGVAGDALRSALTRFTHSPASGALTGAISTAILQSSSATTIIAIGFVGASLLTFPQALGIVFGANIGTTITGWLVALLGFKLKLGTVVLPLILLGALLHLLARGRWSQLGLAIAGFGLIFVGIASLQSGMSGMEGYVTPDSFPGDSIAGRLQLLLLGVVITLITQSSSAGVATAITAVYNGTINFEQAAAMVIGMDIGTTAKAFIATIGGSTESRRTGYSHVIYNLCTGVGAFLLLTPYVWVWEWLSPGRIYAEPEIALVAFHTTFNGLGVILVLPFATPFANLITRLVPEKTSALVKRLDKRLLSEPFIALEAVRSTLEEISIKSLDHCQALMQRSPDANAETLLELEQARESTQRYLDLIHSSHEREREWRFLMACMHCIDHLQRFHYRLRQTRRAQAWQKWPSTAAVGKELFKAVQDLRPVIAQGHWSEAAQQASHIAELRNSQAHEVRNAIMSHIAAGEEDTVTGDMQLETVRWSQRVAQHIWRICHYMTLADEASHKDIQPQIKRA